MKRVSLVILAAWALLVSPSLCRAGVLVACCDPAEDVAPECPDDGCCGEPASSNTEDPDERDCGACADICAANIKPPERLATTDLCGHACELATASHCGVISASARATLTPIDGQPPPNLPYPPSDVPLLI